VLFSDGTSGKLRLERDAGSEPKVFLLGRPSREALLSAERGSNTPYFALRRRGLIGRVCDFFEVAHDSDRALGVLGETTGLPFALAFAAYAVVREHERVRPVSFAASGGLAGGTMHAEVSGAAKAAPIGVAVEAILMAVETAGLSVHDVNGVGWISNCCDEHQWEPT